LLKLILSKIKISFWAIIIITLLTFSNNCYALINATDSAEMIWVPGATFTMGNDWYEFPKHQVTLSGYWIYKYEVTVAKYRAFCTATGHALPTFPTGYSWAGKSNWTNATLQQHPIVNVSWNDAKAYADWAHVSLPTEAQWEYAACGITNKNYPWGGTAAIDDYYNGFDSTKCANYANSYNKSISTWAVGSFPAGASWCGAQDMAGNVWEWCSDYWDLYNDATVTNPTGPATGDSKVLRGGSWSGDAEYSTRTDNRLNYTPADATPIFGFRCVSTAAGPLTAVALAISPNTLLSVGNPITLTATANGGSTGIQYKFMNGTTVLQDFAANNIFIWTPTTAGAATLSVIAKDTDVTTVTSSTINATINPVLSAVALSASPANITGLGTPITLTATAAGGVAVQYKFMNGAAILRDYATDNTFTWNPAAAGATALTVIAEDGNITVTSPVVNYTVNPALTAVSLTTTPVNTVAFGLPVTLTATATGGTGVQYRFMNGTDILRDFNAANTFAWTPAADGNFSLTVVASDNNDTITSPAVNITVNPALTAISLSASANAIDVGTAIKLTATATGGTGVQYKFMNGAAMLRDFTADNIFNWTPANTGNASITVIASDNSATITSTAVGITVNPALTAVALITTPANTVAFGLPVTLNATAVGGTNVKYKFMIGNVILRDFATDNSYTWTPAAAGNITLTVVASDDNSAVTSPEINITVNPPLTAISLSASTNAIDVGTAIKLTATATGGTNVQYKFMNGNTMLRDFTADNIFNWTPADTGNASITVIASDNSATITSTAVNVTVNPVLSAVVLNTSPVNSVAFGLPVTLTAIATGGTNVKYKFMNGDVMLRDFATTNIYKWTPAAAGDMNLTAVASDDNATVTSPQVNITVNPPLTAISLSISANAIDLGKSVTLTATATGGTNVQFMYMNVYTMLSNFTTDNTFIWTPATTGKYYLSVIASDNSATIVSTPVVLIVNQALTTVSLSSSETAVETGTQLTLTATADGGTTVQYKFMNGNTILRDFAAGNFFTWTPATAGNFNLTVVASNANSTVTSAAVNIAVNSPLTAVSLQTSSAVIDTGNPVTLTATATGGRDVQYKFMNGDTILRDFATDNTYVWTPITVGNANITVTAKDVNNTVTSLPIAITVNPNPILTAVLITSSPLNNVAIGTPVTLTATAVGGKSVQYKFMSGTSLIRSFSSSNTLVFTPTAIKTYNFTVVARDINGADPNLTVTSPAISLNIKPVLSAVSFSTTATAPYKVNIPISFTAAATGGASVQYQYLDGNTILQDFASDNTYTWTPTAIGAHNITVVARDNAVNPNILVSSTVKSFNIVTALSAVSLTTSPVNNALIGTPVTLTATSVGGITVQYQFMSGTSLLRSFNSSNALTFTPTTLKTYSFTVIARDTSGDDPNFTVTSQAVTLNIKPALTAVSFSTTAVAPYKVNIPISFTATATGGASVQYQYLDGSTILRDFASDNTYSWTPTTTGIHNITVVSRDSTGDPNALVSSTVKSFNIVTALTSVSLTSLPLNNALISTPVTLTATPVGGISVQYQFMSGTSLMRSFNSSNALTFTPTTLKSYSFTVIARDTSGIDPNFTVTSPIVTLNIKSALTAVSLATSVAGPIIAGKQVTLTATATNGAAVQYKFMDGNAIISDFSSNNVFVWTPPAGTHVLTVIAMDANSPNPEATTVTSAAKNFVVIPTLSAVSLAVTPASTVAVGTPITLAATPVGGMSVQYKFMAGTSLLRSFSSSPTLTFTTSAVKTYNFTVIAIDTGGIDTTATVTSPVVPVTVTP